MTSVFLVTGATGRQGGSTARCLVEQGVRVRALVRNPSSPAAEALRKLGVELIQGDFDNPSAIQAAMVGVSGLFLNLYPTPNPDTQVQQAEQFVEAAKQAGVQSVVVSTAFWTGDEARWNALPSSFLSIYYTPKAAVERTVRAANFASYTILRPSVLMHNYLLPDARYHFPELATEGVLAHAQAAGVQMPHFDAADVGRFAAAALLQPDRFRGHEIELGCENLTPAEAGAILSRVSGQSIQVRQRTEEEAQAMMAQLPAIEFQLWAGQTDVTIDGAGLEERYGIGLTGLEAFLQREQRALVGSLPPGDRL